MPKAFIPRVVYEESVAVLTKGATSAIHHRAIPEEKPLLVINGSEVTPEKIESLIKEGFYRKIYCDVDRVEEIRRNDSDNFRNLFIYIHKCEQEIFEAYERADSPDKKRTVLEKLYDSKIAELSPEIICEKAKSGFAEHEPLLNFLIPIAAFVSKLTPKESGVGLVNSFLTATHKVCDFFTGYKAEAANHRALKTAWFRGEYSTIPEYLRNTLEKIGTQFIVTDSDVGAGPIGLSVYVDGNIYVQTQSIRTLSEEMIHQVDSYLKFSQRDDWKKAIEKDVSPENKSLEKYYTEDNKASLFSGDFYGRDSWEAEVLADMYNMIRIGANKFPNFQNDFPNTYPLFKEFIAQAKQVSAEYKEERLNKEAAKNPEQHQFSKRLKAERTQSDGSGRSLGGERTEPTQRTSWVKTVTP